ncbi:sulfurtransferase complex subunit TusC [Parahaliea sp. F7430]|uniref:Sulfurtransferase complex subunit TusC n=1 Tax=Sediminihaliea albiluteola TaxID=2758564 RepID=A0A7W2TUL1_9GAMM|nr:sulfurtransferase complex subunit TusC [Sediminihaliea albiluteola]MBA6412168.1 sulfurtransferase complex subunit TusC [Sediminihaliea albiluteola]
MTQTKKVLLLTRHAPYGGSLARAAVDAALAAAAFEQAPSLLFMGDAVLQLVSDQDASAVGTRSHGRVLESLPLYDIDQVFVDQTALLEYGLTSHDLAIDVILLDDPAMRQMLADHDHILSF